MLDACLIPPWHKGIGKRYLPPITPEVASPHSPCGLLFLQNTLSPESSSWQDMGRRNRINKRSAEKENKVKREEERQGRLTTGAKAELGVRIGEQSRSRSRLGRGGKKGRKSKNETTAPSVGLFVTKELDIAIETTKATVENIAKECKLKNKRFRFVDGVYLPACCLLTMRRFFRDSEFDLEYDGFRCLYGYSESPGAVGKDVQRVTEIFDNPVFFPEGGAAHSSSIRQGSLGDCYFLSALATVSGLPGLIEKICVAVGLCKSRQADVLTILHQRDEAVGVYGFIFYQDKGWVSVIIDE